MIKIKNFSCHFTGINYFRTPYLNIVLTKEISNSEEKFLKKFRAGTKIKELKDQREIHLFKILQRFDLIRAGAAGKFRITPTGEDALGVGVKRYLTNLRLEKKLFKDYMKAKGQNRWLMAFGLLVFIFLLSLFLFFRF